MNRKLLKISEQEEKLILKMYGLLNEQDPMSDPMSNYDLGKIDQTLPSDYLGPGGAFEKNYTPTQDKTNPNTPANQYAKQQEIKRKEKEVKSLWDLYKKWKGAEENTEKLIEGGWEKYFDEDGSPKDEYTDNEITRATWARNIYQKRQESTNNEKIKGFVDEAISILPKFTYVERGTNKTYTNKPDNYNPKMFGGYYESTPPRTIYEPISETTVSLTPSNEELTGNNDFDSKYKVYRSPADIANQLSQQLGRITVDIFGLQKYNKEQLVSNPYLLRLFKPEQIEAALTECAGDATYPFLMSVIQGELLDDQGRVVGRKDISGNIVPYVPPTGLNDEYGGIPCESEWEWRYAVPAQLVAGIVVSIMAPYGGWMMWASLLAEATINAAVLIGSMDSQDPALVKMNTAYLILPFLMETTPFRNLMNSAQFGKEYKKIAQEMIDNFESFKVGGKMDMGKLLTYIDGLPETHKKLLFHLQDKKFQSALKTAMSDSYRLLKTLSKSYKGIKLSWMLKNLPTSVSILVYGMPAGLYFISKYVDAVGQKLGRTLSENERKYWSAIFSHYSEDERQKIVKSRLEFLQEITNMQKQIEQKQKEAQEAAEKSLFEETKKAGEEILGFLEQILKEIDEETKLTSSSEVDSTVKSSLESEAKKEEKEE